MTQTLERSNTTEQQHLHSLFIQHANACQSRQHTAEAASYREELILAYLPVATRIAHRFDRRGPQLDDLEQVARIGLVHAVDRFDPFRGSDFLSFAVPTMVGELKRHFRDTTWAIRVPRRLQEMHLALRAASDELYQLLGHAPTATELAGHMGVGVEQVCEGLEVSNVYAPRSLDEPSRAGTGPESLADVLGTNDPDLERVVYYSSLARAIRDLTDRDRYILQLRFYRDYSQTKIAERVGISQMQVSRILARVLAQLRAALSTDRPD